MSGSNFYWVDQTIQCDYPTVLSHGTVCFVIVCGSNFYCVDQTIQCDYPTVLSHGTVCFVRQCVVLIFCGWIKPCSMVRGQWDYSLKSYQVVVGFL